MPFFPHLRQTSWLLCGWSSSPPFLLTALALASFWCFCTLPRFFVALLALLASFVFFALPAFVSLISFVAFVALPGAESVDEVTFFFEEVQDTEPDLFYQLSTLAYTCLQAGTSPQRENGCLDLNLFSESFQRNYIFRKMIFGSLKHYNMFSSCSKNMVCTFFCFGDVSHVFRLIFLETGFLKSWYVGCQTLLQSFLQIPHFQLNSNLFLESAPPDLRSGIA